MTIVEGQHTNALIQIGRDFWWAWPIISNTVQWFLGGIVSSMDMPAATDSRSYRFWFKMLNYVASNPARAKAATEKPATNIEPVNK